MLIHEVQLITAVRYVYKCPSGDHMYTRTNAYARAAVFKTSPSGCTHALIEEPDALSASQAGLLRHAGERCWCVSGAYACTIHDARAPCML